MTAVSPTATKLMISCASVSQRHGWRAVPALVECSLEVYRGEMLGVLGPSGAGKSTLLRLMAALEAPTIGTVMVDGVDTRLNQPPLQGIISYLPQRSDAPGGLAVGEYVYFAGVLRGMPPKEAHVAAHDLLDRCGLAALSRRSLRDLVGGQARLARFCATLMGYPQVLLLDEPTEDLDPLQRRWVWSLLEQLHRQTGVTTVIVTHDGPSLERLADRVAVLNAGHIVAVGSAAMLHEQFGRGPRLEVKLARGVTLAAEQRDRLRALGRLSLREPDGFILFPKPEILGSLAASIPINSTVHHSAEPVPAAVAPAKGRKRAAKTAVATLPAAVATPATDTWLLDRQVPMPGTLGRSIEEIFAIIGPEQILECWFAPPDLSDVVLRIGGLRDDE